MATKFENSRAVTVTTENETDEQLQGLIEDLSDEERDFLFKAMSGDVGALEKLKQAMGNHYREVPVSPEVFFSSRYYIGEEADSIYPAIAETLCDVYNGDYSEIILTG